MTRLLSQLLITGATRRIKFNIFNFLLINALITELLFFNYQLLLLFSSITVLIISVAQVEIIAL